MSAFLVSPKHIGTLAASFCFSRASEWRHIGTCDEIAETLARQNLRSVESRYPDLTGRGAEEFLSISNQDYIAASARASFDVRNALQYSKAGRWHADLLKAAQCYEYQSCETSDWEQTQAAKVCREIISLTISELPGYDAAPWGIEEQRPNLTAV